MVARKTATKSYRDKARVTNAKPRDFRPFEVVQPNVVFNGPVPTHWAMLYIDESGNIGEMSNLPVLIFDARARNAFAEAHGLVPPHDTYNSGSRFGMGHPKRRRTTGPRNDNPFDAQNIEEFENSSEQFPIEIGNRKQVSAFYESGFRRLQQINCRLLAKSFIKVIEPRKQVKHPYNGGKGAAPGQKGDPEKTKPNWWPRDVMHREPDHIKKELRLKLLVHLVQNLLPMGITAEMLEDAADDTRRHLQPEDQRAIRALIVDEIFRVRKIEERFERNEIDGSTQVYVSDHDGAKNGEPQSDDEEEEKEETGEEEERSGVLTPPATVTSSPHMQQLEVSPRALDLVTIPEHVSPMVTSSSFQMPTDLNFTNPAQNPTEFTCTQPEMSHTVQPLTTSMLTPNHNQFLDPASFGEPGPANHLQAVGVHDPSHTPSTPSTPSFTGWSPSFQQNMFSPVVYPGSVDRQMSSHMVYPYGQFSSPQNMAPTFAMPEASRSQEFDVTNMYHLPFRTGSLSHPHVLPRRNSEAEHRM